MSVSERIGVRLSRRRLHLVFLVLLVLVLTLGAAQSRAAGPRVRGEEVEFSGFELAMGTGEGVKTGFRGLSLEDNATATFTSTPIKAPLPFTDVGARWKVETPIDSLYSLELRTSKDGKQWESWVEVEGDLDWMNPESGLWIADLIGVPQSDRLHRFVQYRWHLSPAPDGSTPVVKSLSLSFIDAGESQPSLSYKLFGALSARAVTGFEKPQVISRNGWGCPDGLDSPDWEPEYEPVTHIVIHHTVTPNNDTDFSARVRAIWYYHTVTNGWGDIGYNYLVARDGSLYEGRAGGDDVIGAHASGHNHGSMGVSFMGTFTSASENVPQSMMDGATEIVAWKVYQKGFDPEGWEWLSDSYVPRIAGHRDVGQTACPGDALYNRLPGFRIDVAEWVNSAASALVDNTDIELSGPASYWHNGPAGCGYDGDALWTFSVAGGSATNSGKWRPNLPKTGSFRVFAFVPYCINGYPDSEGVTYRIRHSTGDSYVQINQNAAAGGWAELGRYDFNAGTNGYVYLDDVAIDGNHTIWFDAVKWQWAGDTDVTVLPPENVKPVNGDWLDSQQVTFRWSASPTEGVERYHLIIAKDPALSQVIKEDLVDYADQDYGYTFDGDYLVYWGVEAEIGSKRSETSEIWSFGVDTVAPVASISHVIRFSNGSYLVSWTGDDAHSGLATFDVQYKEGSESSWNTWLVETSYTNGRWPQPVVDPVYFRVRARDKAGNLGLFDDGSRNTDLAIQVYPQMLLPLVTR